MNLVSQPITASITPVPVALDWLAVPFNATVNVIVLGGATATYGVEYTLDNIMTTPPANVRWVADPNLPAGTTSSAGTSTYNTPRAAVRCNLTAVTGAGVEFKVAQGTQ